MQRDSAAFVPALCRGAGGRQRLWRCTNQRGYSLSQKRISPLEPQEKDFVLSDCGLKNCTRCAIRCLLDDVSKRFDFLLSSLSLCLRVGGLTQFPSTLDFINSVVACQGGIASLAAIFAPSVDGDYTAPEQDSRAAADDRSRGKSYSSFNAATPRYGQCNRQAPHLFELLARNGKRLSFGRATPVFFLGKENGGRIRAAPAALLSPRRLRRIAKCVLTKYDILHIMS